MTRFTSAPLQLETLDAREVPAVLMPPTGDAEPVSRVGGEYTVTFGGSLLGSEPSRATDYSAVVFVGGWGASSYQYAFSGTYNNAASADDVWVDGMVITAQDDRIA